MSSWGSQVICSGASSFRAARSFCVTAKCTLKSWIGSSTLLFMTVCGFILQMFLIVITTHFIAFRNSLAVTSVLIGAFCPFSLFAPSLYFRRWPCHLCVIFHFLPTVIRISLFSLQFPSCFFPYFPPDTWSCFPWGWLPFRTRSWETVFRLKAGWWLVLMCQVWWRAGIFLMRIWTWGGGFRRRVFLLTRCWWTCSLRGGPRGWGTFLVRWRVIFRGRRLFWRRWSLSLWWIFWVFNIFIIVKWVIWVFFRRWTWVRAGVSVWGLRFVLNRFWIWIRCIFQVIVVFWVGISFPVCWVRFWFRRWSFFPWDRFAVKFIWPWTRCVSCQPPCSIQYAVVPK